MNELYRQFRNRRVLPDEAKWKELTLFLFVESRLYQEILYAWLQCNENLSPSWGQFWTADLFCSLKTSKVLYHLLKILKMNSETRNKMLLSISIGYRDYAMFFLRRRAGWGDSCVYEEWKCHSTWSGCCILSFLKKTLVELFGTKFRTSGSEIQHNRKSKPVVWNLETTENRNQVTKSKIYFAKGCQHLCSAICTLSSRQSLASAEIAWMDCRI